MMAMWCFRCVLQLLIISRLLYFLSAQVFDDTAKLSTSWTNNNNPSMVTTTRSTDISFMRIVLLKEGDLVTDFNGGLSFACGFLSNGADDSFIFAVGILTYTSYFSGETGMSPPHYGGRVDSVDLVWFANRNKPIRENGTLHLLPNGDLVLKDADGALAWSTNTAHRSVVGMKMMNTGNLVLYDNYNRTIWQSFDHPTHTLLNGQKLMAGQKLMSGVSATNWSEGKYSISVTSQGLFAYYQSNNIPILYFKFWVQGPRESMETSYVKSVNGTLALYISSTEPSEPDTVFLKPSEMLYMRLDLDGHFSVYNVYDVKIDLLAGFLSECEYPTVCGNFGLCTNGFCSCPSGYTQVDVLKSTDGCSEISPAICNGPHSHRLLNLKDVYYFNNIDTDVAVLKGTDVESCKQACLQNCYCKIAFFQFFLNFSHGNCFLPSPVLSLINDGKGRNLDQSYAFIKISNGVLSAAESSRSINRNGIIAGSSVGAFIIIVMAIGIWNVFLRKKKSAEEDGDDYFDQFSGLPMRFSYEELKVATGNFLTKLGEGGFGSVFEGNLSNGEKIAVKRLDGFGQGKKEFLAEVKTIGNIHHVNLVRLVGFCAENLHRLLVYEFMANGSLDRWIFTRNPVQPPLDWQARRNIILDIAKGLAYLHEDCRQRIVHLDIKPQNILLDSNLHAKVSDFGLSKLIERDQSQIITTMRGTPGYLAPEWLTSVITEKADVYSFGIVVMETICGRKNLDRSQPEEFMHLLMLFMRKAEENQLIDMVDKNSDDMHLHGLEAVEIMKLATWCLQHDYTRRPSMSMVVKVIEGTMDIEANLDYDFTNMTTRSAIKVSERGTKVTLLPSILSGPR